MKNLLVPIGSSGNGPNTLQYAIDLAQKLDAKVYVAQVYESTRVSGSLKNLDAILEEDSTNELLNILSQIDRKNVELASVSIKGNVIDSIEALAEYVKADLIVSSAKPLSKDETLYLGKIAGRLVKDTSIPVLIVPSQYRYKDFTKVLMALKVCNIQSEAALNPLRSILETYNSELSLIHVITPDCSKDDAEMSAQLKELAGSFKTSENATVFQGVLEHLHITEPDLLCVMRRKRGFFNRLWQEDVVKKADFESRLPLLILKGIS